MKFYKVVLIPLLLTIALYPTLSITAGPAKFPPHVKEMVLETRKQIRTIDMESFRVLLENPQGALIIDVREPKAFGSGHIPGAINIPRGLIEFRIWKHVGYPAEVDYNKKIYVYCGTGARCTLATKTLQDLGFSEPTAVVMKLAEWKKAGYPLVKS
jgi:rhodanese-related sulfurtransferase